VRTSATVGKDNRCGFR